MKALADSSNTLLVHELESRASWHGCHWLLWQIGPSGIYLGWAGDLLGMLILLLDR